MLASVLGGILTVKVSIFFPFWQDKIENFEFIFNSCFNFQFQSERIVEVVKLRVRGIVKMGPILNSSFYFNNEICLVIKTFLILLLCILYLNNYLCKYIKM